MRFLNNLYFVLLCKLAGVKFKLKEDQLKKLYKQVLDSNNASIKKEFILIAGETQNYAKACKFVLYFSFGMTTS